MSFESITPYTDLTTANRPIYFGGRVYEHSTEVAFDMHYELEMGIVLGGKMCRRWEGGRTEELSTGDLWFHGPWQPHGFRISEAPCEDFVAVMRPEVLSDLVIGTPPRFDILLPFKVSPGNTPKLPPHTHEHLFSTIRRIQSLDSKSQKKVLLQRALFLDIYLTILLDWQKKAGEAPSEFPGTAIQQIGPALQLVFTRRSPVTIDAAARSCSMSTSRFRKRFSESTGISFGKFALRARLKQAAGVLAQTKKPVKEIAEEWGFSDVSHFYRTFRKTFDCTPREYRIQARS